MKCDRQRSKTIDAAKGIGILFVYFGHLLVFGSPASAFVFSFHMPLFFIISGMLDNADQTQSMLTRLKKVFNSLIIPLIVFNAIGLACFAVRLECPFPTCFDYEPWRAFYCSLVRELNVGNVSAWFLVCLAGTKIAFFSLRNVKCLWLILFLCYFAGNEIGRLPSKVIFGMPFMLWSIPVSTFFFGVGHLLRRSMMHFTPPRVVSIGLAALFFMFTILCQTGETPNIAMSLRVNPAFFLCSAFCGTLAVLCLARGVAYAPLCFIGQHSLCFFTMEGHARKFVMLALQHLGLMKPFAPMKERTDWWLVCLIVCSSLALVGICVPMLERILAMARTRWSLTYKE